MTAFPLPRPTGSPVDLRPVDVAGAQFRAACTPELAEFASPVLERWVWRHGQEPAADGQATGLGFSLFWLRQCGPAQFQIQTSDYDAAEGGDDLVDKLTDDLSAALWVEGSQDDVLRRADCVSARIGLSDEVLFERAALDAIENNTGGPLILERMTTWDTEENESGWIVSVPGTTSRRARRTVPIMAGLLVSAAPFLIPFLRLPGGSLVEFAGRTPRGVWWTHQGDLDAAGVSRASEAFERLVRGGVSDHLLDSEGNAPGGQRKPDDVATLGSMLPIPQDPRITLEEVQNGVRLVAKTAPQFDQIARAIMGYFFESGATNGAAIAVGYNIFWLQQIGPADFQVTSPDFSDPSQYLSRRTDDLTAALWAHGTQYIVTRAAAAQGDNTFLRDEVAVQQAVIDDLTSGAHGNLMMLERCAVAEDERVLDDGHRRSGWMVTKLGPELSEDQRQLRRVDAGSLIALAPMLVPFLTLPDNSIVLLNGEELIEARLLDRPEIAVAAAANPQATQGDVNAMDGTSRVVLRGRRD